MTDLMSWREIGLFVVLSFLGIAWFGFLWALAHLFGDWWFAAALMGLITLVGLEKLICGYLRLKTHYRWDHYSCEWKKIGKVL